jgi:hypothetical protein
MIKTETVLRKVNTSAIVDARQMVRWRASACIRSRKAVIRQLAAARSLGKTYLAMKSGVHEAKLKDILAKLEELGVKILSEDNNKTYWKYIGYAGTMKTMGKVDIQFYYDSRGPAVEVKPKGQWYRSSMVLHIHYSTKRLLVTNRSLDRLLAPKGE